MFDTLTRMGASGAEGAYKIERSLRFNSADDTYLEFTPSSTGNQKVWTFSCWLKRTRLGTNNDFLFSCNSYSGNTGIAALYWYIYNASTQQDDLNTYFDTASSGDPYGNPISNGRLLQDFTSWYHIVWQVDAVNTTQKLWINGEEQTLNSAQNPPNQNYGMNLSGTLMRIGRSAYATNVFNGYIAEVHYCDGQKYQASDFGETDSTTGQWIPKEVSGLTYGTNGCYLNFSDNSDTTAATLGKDYSGNGNNWTPNNFSVTAGTGNDSLTDTPTNNYCTWNTLDYVDGGFGTSWGAMSRTANGALEMTASGKNTLWHGTFFKNSGKWYYESTGWNHDQIKGGWGRSATSAGTEFLNANCFTLNQNGQFQSNSPTGTAGGTTYGGSISSSDVIGCAIDLDNLTVAWSKNGQWGDGSGNWDETYDNASKISITAGYWTPTHIHGGSSAGQCFANFGQRPFANDPPSGFKTLCASDISTPTIKDPSKYFNTITYTGNNSADRDITGVGFQPDFLWIKNRDQADWHLLQDSVRGANKALFSNESNAESTDNDNGHVNSFLADGFNVTAGDQGNVNENSEDYVAWSWKESASAGFDIVAYTGTGSATTISHSLGVKPDVIIVKNRDEADGWQMYHSSMGATYTTQMDGAGIFEDDDSVWNDTEPTSSVFSVKNDGKSNTNGEAYIAYLWSGVGGYSKFGTYQGNGNAEGPFVYTGFRPAYILTKRVETTPNNYWNIFDTARDPYNSAATADFKRLRVESDSAEATNHTNYTPPDILSNGFKIRHGRADLNYADKKFIYLAFAERPFKYANAR